MMSPVRRVMHIVFSVLVALAPALFARPAASETDLALEGMSRSFQALARGVSPAVVQIFISRYAPTFGSEESGVELFARQRGTGSGVVVDPEGFILTNAHVVAGAERIRVLLSVPGDVLKEAGSILKPKGVTVDAKLVGIDSETDLALIRVKETGLPHLPFGDSDELSPGELVFAFGSPLGLDTSVTLGVVSGTARQLQPEHPMIYIQTDASINPGNSGGPLVNTRGEIVGINTLILSQSGGNEGLGFAAPSNIVKAVYRQLRASGRVRRGQIGATVQTITPGMAEAMSLDRTFGVIVADVVPGSAAEVGGLRVGDVVLSMDGKPMENGRQFTVNLYQREPGEMVSLNIVRNQATKTLRIEVHERSDDPTRFASMVTLEENLVSRLGILAMDIDRTLRRMLPPLRMDGGILVAARAAGALPWQSVLSPGDVIYTLDRQPVPDLESLRRRVEELPRGAVIVLQIERNRGLRYLTLELD